MHLSFIMETFPRVYAGIWHSFKKSIFLSFLAARLHFCRNGKNIKEQDTHFSKIITAHWNTLSFCCAKTFFFLVKQYCSYIIIYIYIAILSSAKEVSRS